MAPSLLSTLEGIQETQANLARSIPRYPQTETVDNLRSTVGLPPVTGGLADGIEVVSIGAYQTIRIPLVEDSRPTSSRNAPIIANKNLSFVFWCELHQAGVLKN